MAQGARKPGRAGSAPTTETTSNTEPAAATAENTPASETTATAPVTESAPTATEPTPAPAAEPAQPAPPAAATKPARDQKNGITRPAGNTATGRVWAIADELTTTKRAAEGANGDERAGRKEVIDAFTAEGGNQSTGATQFGRWLRYNGFTEARAGAAQPAAAQPAPATVEPAEAVEA